jgi:hypothetical protein
MEAALGNQGTTENENSFVEASTQLPANRPTTEKETCPNT